MRSARLAARVNQLRAIYPDVATVICATFAMSMRRPLHRFVATCAQRSGTINRATFMFIYAKG